MSAEQSGENWRARRSFAADLRIWNWWDQQMCLAFGGHMPMMEWKLPLLRGGVALREHPLPYSVSSASGAVARATPEARP